MGKSTYKVNAIKSGMELKYREFWVEGKKVSEDGTELRPDILADTAFIEAKNKSEAEELARQKFPARKLEVSRLG